MIHLFNFVAGAEAEWLSRFNRWFQFSFLYFRFYLLATLRNIPALFFTLIFPPLIFILSIHLWGSDPVAQRAAYLTFANYSVQTVCFMLLGMGVSQEKNSNWSHYARTLPVPISVMVAGRILHTIALAFMNMGVLTCIALVVFAIPLTFFQILCVFLVCAFGAIPFALMGITIGYLANFESARSIFTLVNLLFLFGAFGFSSTGIIYRLQELILSYQWVKLQKSIFDPNISIIIPIISLVVYMVVFAAIASVSIRKAHR